MTSTAAAAVATQSMTIGNGSTVHTAYYVVGRDGQDRLCGSLCDTGVYCKGSRMRLTTELATCSRCAKATDRLSGARPAK